MFDVTAFAGADGDPSSVSASDVQCAVNCLDLDSAPETILEPANAVQSPPSILFPPGDYYLGATINLPAYVGDPATGRADPLIIRGISARLVPSGAPNLTMFARFVGNPWTSSPVQATAEEMLQGGRGWRFEGLWFQDPGNLAGTSCSAETAIRLDAVRDLVIERCEFVGFRVAVDLRFVPNVRIERSIARGSRGCGFRVRAGAWTDATPANSGSHGVTLTSCGMGLGRCRGDAEIPESALIIEDSNDVLVDHCGFEASDSDFPIAHRIKITASAMNDAKHLIRLRNLYFENKVSSSDIRITAAGSIVVDGIQLDAVGTSPIIDTRDARGTQLVSLSKAVLFTEGPPVLMAGHPSYSHFWLDPLVQTTTDMTRAANWVGGILPASVHQENVTTVDRDLAVDVIRRDAPWVRETLDWNAFNERVMLDLRGPATALQGQSFQFRTMGRSEYGYVPGALCDSLAHASNAWTFRKSLAFHDAVDFQSQPVEEPVIHRGTDPPAPCVPGQLFFDIDAGPSSRGELLLCVADGGPRFVTLVQR